MAFNSNFEAWATEKLPVPQSWRDAVENQSKARSDYKSIHKNAGAGGGIPMEEIARQQNHEQDPEREHS